MPTLDPTQYFYGALSEGRRRRRADEMEHEPFEGVNVHPLDIAAAATSAIPVVGDVVGLAADARQLSADPSWGNAAMMGLGALPFVPPVLSTTRRAMPTQVAPRAPEEGTLAARDFRSLKATKRNQKRFSEALTGARSRMGGQDAAQVDPLPEGFKGRLFMTEDGRQGFAITDQGMVTNLYRDPEATSRGTMDAALIKARAEGARNLEAFDTYLAPGYQRRGAVETGRSTWDPNYAPPGWDEATMGTPDYVEMDIGGYFPEQRASRLAPVEQRPLERYDPPHGQPKQTRNLYRGGASTRMQNYANQGIGEGGHRWYWTGGIKDKFMERSEALGMGAEEGARLFDRFMDLTSAVSPRSKVDQEIRRGSVLFQRERQGLPIDDMPKEAWPEGYGHIANNTHMKVVRNLLETGNLGGAERGMKVASYGENKRGNLIPLTADTHHMQLLTGRADWSPSKTEYPYVEQQGVRAAERAGLAPAEFQAAAWVGGRDVTGVADARNYTAAMNQRLAKTAEVLNVSEEEAIDLFLKGDTRLYQVLLALGGGAGGAALMSGEEPPTNL